MKWFAMGVVAFEAFGWITHFLLWRYSRKYREWTVISHANRIRKNCYVM